jgi:prolyl oligopeptidase
MPSGLPNLDQPDNDPWLWLEEVDGPDALAWADGQTVATLVRFGGPAFERDRDTLRALLDRPDKLPFVTRRGGLLYNFWLDAAHPRGLWRRTTMEGYRQPDPDWDILLDLDALAAAEGEDWVWSGAATLPPDHGRALLRLSRGGGDATVLREYDIPSRRFVADGFVLPEAKGGGQWLDQNTLLLVSALGGTTRSGYARTVRLWRRGADPAEAPVLFETDPAHMAVDAEFDRANGRVLFVARTGFFDMEAWIGTPAGPQQRVDLPSDAAFSTERGWMAVRPRKPWAVGGQTHPPDTVLCVLLDAYLAGERNLRVVFTPEARRSLQGFFWSNGRLVLSILDELQPIYRTVDPTTWNEAALPGLPAIGTVQAWPLDAEESERDGTLLAASQDPLTPLSLLLLTSGEPELLKQAPSAFDPAGLVTTRHEAVSADGERIPYVQVGPPGLTGDAPVHMTAYGGFGISLLPAYKGGLGKLWLEPGGTLVVANLRGGGEFGTRWHDAGRREGKARSHDDFAAVASDLVARGVTRPGRIAAEGGSNGGLLIANMLTRYPDRFGALFCTIPLIDMRRYTRLLAGASWIAEYGDPDVPEDWAFIAGLSAYHAARPGKRYPPILLATARRDDRVHPGHARKMAAKLQAMGYDASFYEPAAGGHGYGKDNAETAAFMALGINFLRQKIGWV